MLKWVTRTVAVSGGNIVAASWPEIRAQTGVSAVVNLRAEQEDHFLPPLPEAYLWLPVEDYMNPSLPQLLLGAQFVETAVRAGHKVLIHCRMGLGRSRTLASAYLIWTGRSVDEAILQVEGTLKPEYAPERRIVLERFAALLEQERNSKAVAV